MMAEALGRWLRDEMELPPSATPSPAALRRLCSGPTAPIWDFITRHVRNRRNVQKIRGNRRWYGHLQELETPPGPPSRQGALRAALSRLRKELQDLGDAIEGAQDTAQRLELSLQAQHSRRWAELQRGAELRLMGAEPQPEGLRGLQQGALEPPGRGQSRAQLSAILASGAEPEVLVSIKALIKARQAELWRPRPPRKAQEEPPEARDWLEEAEAVLIGCSPEGVLWALETLANQSTRELQVGPAPSPEAPPTLRSLIQERWVAVGALWGALSPLLSRLSRLRRRLRELQPRLGPEPACRLSLLRAALGSFRDFLLREIPQIPQNSPKNSQNSPNSPGPALGRLRRRLRRGRERALRGQQRLRFLSAASRGRRAGLRPLQEQVVGVARAGPGSAPPPLWGEGQRRRSLVLGALGALGAPLPHPGAPPPARGLGRELGACPGALLPRAAILRQQLRQGALSLRRGAGPARGAWPKPPLPPELPEGVAELLPRLRLVSANCEQRIQAWPRLQGLLSQWWTQPAQWALATPPGHAPFSHWLQRWRDAAHALQATPTPVQATPTAGKGEEPEEEAPPL